MSYMINRMSYILNRMSYIINRMSYIINRTSLLFRKWMHCLSLKIYLLYALKVFCPKRHPHRLWNACMTPGVAGRGLGGKSSLSLPKGLSSPIVEHFTCPCSICSAHPKPPNFNVHTSWPFSAILFPCTAVVLPPP